MINGRPLPSRTVWSFENRPPLTASDTSGNSSFLSVDLIPVNWSGKTSRFSEQQIAFILKQVEDGTTVEEVCRKAGISIQTYYRWRSKCGGLMPSEMKRLKQLEDENVRLKRLVANLSLDKEMLQDITR